MKNNSRGLFSLFLMSIVLFSVFSLIQQGSKYIGKDYFDSDSFQAKLDNFTFDIGPLLLNPIDADEAKKTITVTENEIEEHRNRYGTLSEQVENINNQYQNRIAQAIDSNAKKVKETLIKERDSKIDDITKNFEDNDYIKEKVIASKKKAIDNYMLEMNNRKKDLLDTYRFFAFQLTDVDTQKTMTYGEIESPAAFSVKYGKGTNLLRTYSVSSSYPEDRYDNNSYSSNGFFASDTVTSTDVEEVKLTDKTYQYEGKITVPKSALKYTEFEADYNAFKSNQVLCYIIWFLGFVSVILLLTVCKPTKKTLLQNNDITLWIRKWPMDAQIVGLLVAVWALFINSQGIMYKLEDLNNYSRRENMIGQVLSFGFPFIIFCFLLWISLAQAVSILENLNSEEKRLKAYERSFVKKTFENLQDLFLNRSLGFQSVILVGIIFLAGVGFTGAMVSGQLFVIYTPLFLFIALPATILFLTRMSYLNRIMKETEQMAAGRLSNEIKIQGKSAFAIHAGNLNELRDGVRTSISEQAKSERLKTELITNVSHDLRTPLTSIITYTDLLKKPNVTEEERNSYIAILDKKSQRLKTLIEDLFEVSKMASGNIELHKQRVDLNQLLQQALAEHEEDITKSELDFRVNTPDGPLFAYVDGQKWWRMLDNLIINTLKYTMEGTRVYVTLSQKNGEAEFIIKNVTKYEIGEDVEELYERFKRADTSRHTDGSGLGLAIAQSIVDLHGARMKIEVDGDLFKVTVNVVSVY
ncbi:two-component sensor histidine kinase [Viridibacillus sp. YIM B01967]|uniref:histidine kinase n=1 Tax=Viridibacillus soli TaxID=2798301 RepID=A0ABS1H7Z1_9BACL|nr:HAMP domain-containing sensor histidine kinase [Viridibacillus soli]MBK3495529.1 two-component sensor histidine kinase [Viridibacillus soli]